MGVTDAHVPSSGLSCRTAPPVDLPQGWEAAGGEAAGRMGARLSGWSWWSGGGPPLAGGQLDGYRRSGGLRARALAALRTFAEGPVR